MTIRILPPELASQIAAGEVVERPASVVKELLENSLDAGASNIQITVEGAGKRLIELADNGCGIPAAELPLSVERHATSKIETVDNLFAINTLGFRGEALSSIGSVSRMTITSRSGSERVGTRLVVDGGVLQSVQSVGAPAGTLVRVENLFFNVPARLKVLKSDQTERTHIDRLATRYAVAYPSVRFELLQEGRQALVTSGNGNHREALAALYGVEIARQMLEVIASDQDLQVTGFISPTNLTRSNRREVTFFVNGRPVQDPALSAALMKGYHTLLMVGRYPIAILFLEIPPSQVDVNVHPTKAEVRFREQDQVFVALQGAVRRALLAHTPVPGLKGQVHWAPGSTGRMIDLAWEIVDQAGVERSSLGSTPDQRAYEPDGEQDTAQKGFPGERVPLLRLIGQVATTYLVAEGPDGLYLIDQHAAHERILYEKFLNQLGGEIPAQQLLEPAMVEFPPSSARLLEDQLPVLERLGFQVEPFGHNTFLVRAIPEILMKMKA